MVLDSNFKEFIQLLNANEVKYLVVGGFAVAYHGYPRYTKDIDFWIWADPDNADRLMKAISDFGMGALGLEKADFMNPGNIVQIGYEPNRIDLIMDLEGLDFDECYAQRQEAVFEHIPICFIDLEHLLQNKMNTGRLKDKLDAQTLRRKQSQKSEPKKKK